MQPIAGDRWAPLFPDAAAATTSEMDRGPIVAAGWDGSSDGGEEMPTRLTLIGGPLDGETLEVPDDYGTKGVFFPHAGRTHVYLSMGDLERIDGSIQRYAKFDKTLDIHIPEPTA